MLIDYETSVRATQLIKGDACYFGLFDYMSPANRPGMWGTLFQAAKKRAGRQQWQTLFHLNQSWSALAEENALLSWITLFDGVFKVEVRLLPEGTPVEFSRGDTEHFIGDGKSNQLYCPSGKIVVASLVQLGSCSIDPIMTLTRGVYKVGFHRNEAEESKHEFLEDEDQYPANEGPDWIVYMQREE